MFHTSERRRRRHLTRQEGHEKRWTDVSRTRIGPLTGCGFDNCTKRTGCPRRWNKEYPLRVCRLKDSGPQRVLLTGGTGEIRPLLDCIVFRGRYTVKDTTPDSYLLSSRLGLTDENTSYIQSIYSWTKSVIAWICSCNDEGSLNVPPSKSLRLWTGSCLKDLVIEFRDS